MSPQSGEGLLERATADATGSLYCIYIDESRIPCIYEWWVTNSMHIWTNSTCECAAVCCSVLQCVAVCYSMLQCVSMCYSVLQCVAECAVCCSELLRNLWLVCHNTGHWRYCNTVCCSVLQCVAVCCSVLTHNACLCCYAVIACCSVTVLQRCSVSQCVAMCCSVL